MEMYIEPIEVTIEDPRLLSQLLPFIDREDFLTDIQAVRTNRLKMSGLYERKFVDELRKYHFGLTYGFITKEGFPQTIKRLNRQYKNVSEIPISYGMPISYAFREANILLKKYNKNLEYLIAVLYAILCGKIEKGDYTQNTYSLLLTPETIKEFEPPFRYVAIIINPESTAKETVKVFNETYKQFFSPTNTSFTFPKKNEIPKEQELPKKKRLLKAVPDTSHNIVRNRKWYWENHKKNPNGKGYRKIAKEAYVKLETVISGIKAYSRLLRTSG